MRTESRPNSDYTRTWSPSGEIEYAKLGDGTRLRYLKAGSGPTALILLHTRDLASRVLPKNQAPNDPHSHARREAPRSELERLADGAAVALALNRWLLRARADH